MKDRIQIGRSIAYKLMGDGLTGVNGIKLHISKNLVTVYMDTSLLYGMESLTLGDNEIKMIDAYHRGLLRMRQI